MDFPQEEVPASSGTGTKYFNIDALSRRPYFLLSLFFVAAMASPIAQKLRTGDYWMHSAVIRELAAHPWNPRHPQLLSDAPHAFYSPYSLAIALPTRLLGSDANTTLGVMRVINCILFCLAFSWFMRSLFPSSPESAVLTCSAMLLMLFFWGQAPWDWSGFFHLRAFALTAAYPSTCAMAGTFAAVSLEIRRLRTGRHWLIFPISILAACILITHPTTAVVLVVLLLSVHPSMGRADRLRASAGLGLVFLLSFLGAVVWPYYPFLDLMLRESRAFNAECVFLYEHVLARIWPSLVGIPLLVLRLRRHRTDPLALCFSGLLLVYIYGAVSGSWTYGRVISFLVILVQIATASWLIECKPQWSTLRLRTKLATSAIAVLLIVQILGLAWSAVRRDLPRVAAGTKDLSFISTIVQPYEVVLSDLETSHKVPAFGGKVVAINYFLGWVDHDSRRADVAAFFNSTSSAAQRGNILDKYRVDFVLLNKSDPEVTPALESALRASGNLAHDDHSYTLIRIHRPSPAQRKKP